MKKIIFLLVLLIIVISIFGFGLNNTGRFETENTLMTVSSSPPVGNWSNITSTNVNKPMSVEEVKKIINLGKPSEKEVERATNIMNERIYNEAKSLTKKAKLQNLEKIKFSPEDKELRVWTIEPNDAYKGFITTYKDGRWKAMDITDKDFKNKLKIRYFDEPASGWKAWEEFFEEELIPSKVKSADSSERGADSGIVVIETKSGSAYAKNIFYQSSLNVGELYKIYEKIRVEFYNGKIKWGEF